MVRRIRLLSEAHASLKLGKTGTPVEYSMLFWHSVYREVMALVVSVD